MKGSVPYINYHELEEFYTIPELSRLFQMEESDLKQKCEQFGIKPRRNEIGDYGLVKYDVRKLHNAIYHESETKQHINNEDDPWA